MPVEEHKPHHHAPHHYVLRVAGGLLLLTCLLAFTLFNPHHHPAHNASVNTKEQLAGTHSKVRRDKVKLMVHNNVTSTTTPKTKALFDPIDLHLPNFPTLQAALDKSEVVVLYFGASWCAQSQAVSASIDQVLGPKLKATKDKKRRQLSVVYVSSDASKAQFRNANRNRFWTPVPFGKGQERKRLKKYFAVCAKREMDKLQIERQFEIPHLVVLSGSTHKVVSRRGVQDLKKLGPGVLDYWVNLVRGKLSVAK